jgi:signal transduction histidine kinase
VKFVVKVVRDITERTRTERELDQLYGALEELEAFSYTVSHDLRAPVRAANLQMKQLIDHLSGLSRASREPMSRRCVLLTRLANDVLDDASIRNPGLPITAEVQQGMSAHGDRHMLKIVIENPVSNAVKYSKSTGAARIRFFSTQQESGRAFHISGTEEWEDETA